MKKLLVALVVGALLALPMSAMAMDALTQNQLDAVEGQAGLTMGFGSTIITEISFSSLSWGDPDGVDGTTSAGWLIIQGAVQIDSTINQGGLLVMDIAYTGADLTTNAVTIPSGRTFLSLSLPTMSLDVTVPATLSIGFGTTAGTMGCTLGILNLAGLNVSMNSIDALYIWCHD